MKLLLSSETYAIDPADLDRLPDGSENVKTLDRNKDGIVIRIGNSDNQEEDVLLKGRTLVRQAIEQGVEFKSVRIAFRSRIPQLLSFLSAFKPIRKKYKYHSAEIYHMNPHEIRRMKIERAIRNKDNAYGFRNPKWRPEEHERLPKYQKLVDSISLNGYDDSQPISIMVCRSFGLLDSLNDGHHRISAALDAKANRIAVSFTAVSKPPFWIALILIIPAKIKQELVKYRHKKY